MGQSKPKIETLTKDKFFRVKVGKNEGKRKKRAVVFVHGFAGSPEETWTRAGTSESFYAILASDPELSDHAIYMFKYETIKFKPQGLENIVTQLRMMIDAHVQEEIVLFIAHSMGGLVSMRYLIHALESNYDQRVGGLLLYGCPMTGVEWIRYVRELPWAVLSLLLGPLGATLAKLVPANPQLNQLSRGDFLEKLNSDWVMRVLNGGHDALEPSQKAWVPVRVVTGNDDWVVKESSARALYSHRDWIPLDEDHRFLVKPADRTDASYQIAKDFLTDCRKWASHETLMGLRKILDTISGYRHKMHFRQFNLTLSFESAAFPPDHNGPFGIPGFVPFEVRCQYFRTLSSKVMKVGCAVGSIGFDNLWSEESAFLHGLSVQRREKHITELLQFDKSKSAAHWAALFKNDYVRVAGINLNPEDAVLDANGLSRTFTLPETKHSLIGEDVKIEVGFRGLLEPDTTGYSVKLPWMATGLKVTAVMKGQTRYFTSTSAALGPSEFIKKEEHGLKVEYSTEELVLPGSSIHFAWSALGQNVEVARAQTSGD